MNSWDRLPFLTELRYGVPSFEPLTNQISRNFISADYGGSQAFDNDDGSSWYHSFEKDYCFPFKHRDVVPRSPSASCGLC